MKGHHYCPVMYGHYSGILRFPLKMGFTVQNVVANNTSNCCGNKKACF